MPTQYTKRIIAFVRADVAPQCNQRAKQWVDTDGGDSTWSVPLEQTTAPGVTFAYVCGWTMTPAQFTEMRNRLQEVEATLSNKIRVFDVSGMTAEEEGALYRQKLTLLGLQPLTQ